MANRVCARTILGFRLLQNVPRTMCTSVSKHKIDSAYISAKDIDIESLFMEPAVRGLLKQLTGFDLDRIFAKRRKEYTNPHYKLVTDAQLKQEREKAMRRAGVKLQMPPVLRKRLPCEKVIRKDPEMQGSEKHNIIFTDISFGYTDRFRPIVVRQPNGVLRTATWDERERMLQTYLTLPSKEMITPAMFSDPYLKDVLQKGWYEFVMTRACVQFEPDDERFIEVSHRTFDHINENAAYDVFLSTRFFGPMAFYFAVTRNGDAFVLHLLKANRLEDAAAYVRLLHIIHPESRSRELVQEDSAPMDVVEAYIKLEAKTKTHLELALSSYQDVAQEATA